jgi:uncharacterized protein (DUF4415 family)
MTTRKKKAAKTTGSAKKQGKKKTAAAAILQTIAASARDLEKDKKQQITLRLDVDLIDFYRAMGSGYQAKMSDLLAVAADPRTAQYADKSGLPWYEDLRDHELMRNRMARPRKEQLTLRVASITVERFRSKGKGYQSRMNRVLRLMMVEMIRGKEMANEQRDD